MKIVFWGTPKYAAENLTSIFEAGYEVIAVITQPDRKRNRGKKLSPSPVKEVAIDFGIPVFTTESIKNDQKTQNILLNLNADVYIVVAFGQILPKKILDQPSLGCWNSHASLLPSWRGAAPIQWSIINDDAKTGICIIAMEEGLDTGPVIEMESTVINDNDNFETLSKRLSMMSSKLLVKALDNIKLTSGLAKKERLEVLNAIDQSKLGSGNISYARQLKKEDYLINWNQKAIKISKRIKALYPNAYTFYNGKRIKIFDSEIISTNHESSELNNLLTKPINDSLAGKVIMINKKYGIAIMTKDKPILINSCQLEGKNKTDGYTLSNQTNIDINNILGN